MFLALVVSYLLSFSAINGEEQLKCAQCRGQACNNVNNIPLLECDPLNNKLPYNYEVDISNMKNPLPACVELEYSTGSTRIPVRQCLLITSREHLCREVHSSLPTSVALVKCNVYSRRRNKMDGETPEPEESTATTLTNVEAGTSTSSPLATSTSTTSGEVTPTTVSKETTTEGNANTTFVSFITFSLVVIIHVLL